MNSTANRPIKKVFNLLIALLFLCDLSMGNYAFAGSDAVSEKIQVQNKPDAAYSASQLTKRVNQAKETVDSKNDIIRTAPSPAQSKITAIVESAGKVENPVEPKKDMVNNTSSPAESEISAEDFRIQFDEYERSERENAQRVFGEIGPIVHMAAETLLDSNNDGQINEEDNRMIEAMRKFQQGAQNTYITILSNDGRPGIDMMSLGSRPIDPTTGETLGKLFYWVASNSGNGTMSLYLGNDVELSFSGRDNLLTLRSKNWTIKIQYYEPPMETHVYLKTISCVREAFSSIENTKKTLDNNMKNFEENGKRTAKKMETHAPMEQEAKKILDDNMINSEESSKKTVQKMEPYIPKVQESRGPIVNKQDSSSLYTAKPGRGPSENKTTKSAGNNKSIFNEKFSKGIPENASVKDTGSREAAISNATIDHAAVVEGEWNEAKGTLIKVFEKVLAEDAGAIYSGKNGSINAIILLTSTAAPGNKGNKGDEGEKDKDS